MRDYRRTTSTRTILAGLSAGMLLGSHLTPLRAQTYPERPVRVVLTAASGSLMDSVTRLIFTRVSAAWGQQFIVDNRPAAGGSMGAEAVAKAPADGYTLLSSINSALTVNPFDIQEQADTIYRALTMEAEEKALRARRLREIIEGRDPGIWVDDQLADIRLKQEGRERVS